LHQKKDFTIIKISIRLEAQWKPVRQILKTVWQKRCRSIAVKVAEALGLDTYSRIDFLVNAKDEVYCLEANTLPGMTATSLLPQEAKVEGVNFEELCQRLVDISMEKYGA